VNGDGEEVELLRRDKGGGGGVATHGGERNRQRVGGEDELLTEP
jgi:hypothetical protein